MIDRRHWLKLAGSLPLLGLAAAPLRAGAALTGTAAGWPLGDVFRVDSAGGMALRLAGVLPGPTTPHLRQFGLVFVGAADACLPAATQRLSHPDLGLAGVYLEPMEPRPDSQVYIAEFSLLAEPGEIDARRLWRRLAL